MMTSVLRFELYDLLVDVLCNGCQAHLMYSPCNIVLDLNLIASCVGISHKESDSSSYTLLLISICALICLA